MAAPTPPKAMSSRLLTMKFMQRAAASAPATPKASPKNEEQSSKRRKVSHEAAADAPVDFMVNQQAVQAAIDEGEKKREEAIVKHAAELGDARWVLDVPDSPFNSLYRVKKPLNVVQVGYAHIDSPDVAENDEDTLGDSLEKGHLFRRYNMEDKKKVCLLAPCSRDNALPCLHLFRSQLGLISPTQALTMTTKILHPTPILQKTTAQVANHTVASSLLARQDPNYTANGVPRGRERES